MATKRKTTKPQPQQDDSVEYDEFLKKAMRLRVGDAIPVTIRFPRVIHRMLSERAAESGNSFNSEVVQRCASALGHAALFENVNRLLDQGSDLKELAAEIARVAAASRKK